MNFNPAEKMCKDGKAEKYVLQKAFEGLIPDEVLWRQKEQFSDGVGYNWIDSLKAHADMQISDEMLEAAGEKYPIQPPETKEAYYYRSIFTDLYSSDEAALTVEAGASIACSSPVAFRWSQEFENMDDPSGRAVKVHQKSMDKV